MNKQLIIWSIFIGRSDFMDLCWIVQCICSQSLHYQAAREHIWWFALSWMLYVGSGGILQGVGETLHFLAAKLGMFGGKCFCNLGWDK